jgi:hypothetical protein
MGKENSSTPRHAGRKRARGKAMRDKLAAAKRIDEGFASALTGIQAAPTIR